MAHYLIVQVKVNDDSWIPDYAENVHLMVHRHGGKYLSRSGSITTLEGRESTADLVALIELPTKDATSTDCEEKRDPRQDATSNNMP